jgi:hypothetical protein
MSEAKILPATRGYISHFGKHEKIDVLVDTHNGETLLFFSGGMSSDILCLTPNQATRLANRLLKSGRGELQDDLHRFKP